MARDNIPEYSATASANTVVADINIDEGCAPSGINNAIREVMAALKDVDTGATTLTSPAFTTSTSATIKTATVKHTNDTTSMTIAANGGVTFSEMPGLPSGNLSITGDLATSGTFTLGSTAITATGDDINALKVQGKETIFVPAAAMYPNTTNGCADLEQVELTNGPEMKCLDFDASADEFAQFSIAMPKSWDEGTITFQAMFSVTGTDTGTTIWSMSGVSVSDDATCDVTFGSAVAVTAKAHSGTSNDLNVTAESGVIAIKNAQVDTLTFFQISRSATSDSQTADARLMGIKLFFTTDGKNDA